MIFGQFINEQSQTLVASGGVIAFSEGRPGRDGTNVLPTEEFMVEALNAGDIFDDASVAKIRTQIARTFLNVEDFGAVGDGITNDLDALQAAHDALPETGGVLWFTNTYNVVATLVSGGRAVGLQIWKDNVTLMGPGKIVQTTVGASARQSSVVVNGQAKISRTTPLDPATRDINQPVYPFVGSYPVGSKVLELVEATDVLNFAPGDDIFIRTGNFGGDPWNDIVNQDPDSEYNIVQSVDADAATITLAWPTVKPYAIELFDDTGYGPTRPDYNPANHAAVYGVSNITAMVVRNFTCLIPVENVLGGNYAIYINQATKIRCRDFHVDSFGIGIIGGRCFRDFQFTGISCTRPPGGLQIGGNNFFAPSTACSDGLVAYCTLTSDEPRKMHGHEGIADYRVVHNVFRTKSASSGNAQIQIVTLGGGTTAYTLTIGTDTTASIASTATADDVRNALRAASADILAIGNTFRVTGSVGGPYRVNFGTGIDGDNYGPLMTAAGTGGTVTVTSLAGGQAIISAKSRPYRHTYRDNTFFGAWTDNSADIFQLARGGFGNVIANNRVNDLPGRYLIRIDDDPATECDIYGNTFPTGTTAAHFSLGPLARIRDNRNSPLDDLYLVNAPGATPALNLSNFKRFVFTGLNGNITSMSANLTGTLTDGQIITLRFTDNGTARSITWGSSFAPSTYTSLPGTTVANVPLNVAMQYNAALGKLVAAGLT